jgi:glycosyltransferase involved in cell wall biosynthesis
MKKAVFITNIPAHYRVALISRTSKILKQRGINLITLFSRSTYKRRKYWDVNKDKFDFDFRFLNNQNSIAFTNKIYEIGFNALKAIKEIKPGLIVAAGFSLQSYLVSRHCRKNGIPFMVYSGETGFTAEAYNDVIRRIVRRKISRNTTGYIVYGEKAKEYIQNSFKVYRNIHLVINTVDTDEFRIRLINSELFEKDKFIILFVGDLLKIKGIDLFLNSVAALDDEIKRNIEIWIAGDGEMLDELVNTAITLGIKNIKFFGKINHSQIAYYYKNCDLFVLSSIHERFGLVLVEAAIAGKPLIASKYCGGAYDLIEEGKNGYIVDPNDFKDFSEKIKFFTDSKDKTREFGKYSEKIIKSRVNIKNASECFAKAITENIK